LDVGVEAEFEEFANASDNKVVNNMEFDCEFGSSPYIDKIRGIKELEMQRKL
jgi:hypothetical protein